MKFLLFLAAAGSVLGGLYLFGGIMMAGSAPQEAAAAAYACAFAVIPYVFARACQLYDLLDTEKKRHAELMAALHAMTAKAPNQPAAAKEGTPAA